MPYCRIRHDIPQVQAVKFDFVGQPGSFSSALPRAPSQTGSALLPAMSGSLSRENSRPVARSLQLPKQLSTVDDLGIQQRAEPQYGSSIMNSSPDVHANNLRMEDGAQIARSQVPEDLAQPPALPRADTSRQPSLQGSVDTVSRQPSVPEPNITPSGDQGSTALPAGVARAPSGGQLPKQTSTAEEVMRDYLVGEGIKKAHFRALHPKAPKKKKTGFFASLFDRSNKD